jgi:hypothetical protein
MRWLGHWSQCWFVSSIHGATVGTNNVWYPMTQNTAYIKNLQNASVNLDTFLDTNAVRFRHHKCLRTSSASSRASLQMALISESW